jgi:AmmeMemoRadiSam system protein A
MMSPQSEHPRSAVASELSEYSSAEREQLLNLAHQSIEATLNRAFLDLNPPTAHLAEFRGAFTTLHITGKLRGCIGYVFPTQPLYRTVAETARSAAFEDPRFEPVTLPEARLLQIEISILSPLRTISPEGVVVGKHGLVVTKGNRRGLLLPQVPVEWDWDRETFLSQTCLKAGLPADAWFHEVEVQVFTAEVFSDT